MINIENAIERFLFNSRWLLAPFYVGLVFALALLLFHFMVEFLHFALAIGKASERDVILGVLGMIDMAFTGNLILIVIFSGYENFVSKIDTGDVRERPVWMGTVDFSGLKLKLVSSIVAISAIALLRTFMKIGSVPLNPTEIKWRVIMHLTFVTSGVLLAFMDFLSSRSPRHHE